MKSTLSLSAARSERPHQRTQTSVAHRDTVPPPLVSACEISPVFTRTGYPTLLPTLAIYLGLAWGTSAFGAGAVTLDGSMGTSGALAGPNFQITAAMGQQIGPNLFHSFGTFNLVNGESATFSGPAGIQNILARVTGGSASSIDGSINSTIAGANLFLLNPSGVMFGPNAQVNVTGSFVTGTPDYVKLAGGGVFFTSLGGADNLTSAPISAFGFLAATPAPVTFDGSQITAGTGLHVIGGDITADNGATLFQGSGLLTLFSAASPGEVPFSIASAGDGYASATNPRFGNIAVRNNSAVAIAGGGGGKVVIRAGRLTMDNGFLTSANIGATPGADVSIQASQVAIQNGGTIKTATFASGAGGHINVQADSIAMQADGSGTKGIVGQTFGDGAGGNINVTVTGGLDMTFGAVIGESAAGNGPAGNVSIQAGSVTIDNSAISLAAADAGNAGSLTMNVTGALTLTGFGFIDATAFSSGNAGDIAVHAGSLTIDGTTASAGNNPGIFSQSQASGNAGNVTLTVDGLLVVKAGGEIDSSAFFTGHGGDISVHAGSISLQGSDVPGFATEISSTSAPGATGNAGSVNVDVVGGLSITHAAEISGTTSSSGRGGDVHVHAGSLVVDGSGTANFTGIVASANFGSTANAGSLTVNVDGATTLMARGEISSGTFSSGTSGDVTVTSGALTILGANGVGNPSGIFAQTAGTGNAGRVNVKVAGALGITGFGEIDTSTFASGQAGDVTVRAQTVTLDGSNAPANLSGILSSAAFGSSGPAGSVDVGVAGDLTMVHGAVISSASNGTGPGGSVLVSGGNIRLLGRSAISASAVAADAGTVGVSAANILSLTGGSSIETTAGANGGNITLTAGQLIYLLESQITAQAGLNGGNIDIGTDPQFVVLDHSLISANAALGQGGNITITSRDFLNNTTAITATGTTNGTILISSPDLDLSGSLIALPANLVSDQDRLREKCARAVNHEFSTFIVVGRGGTEAAPEEYQPDFGLGFDRETP